MKRIILALFVCGLLWCLSVYAFRVGVFDLHKVLRNNAQVKAIQAKLKKRFLPHGKKIVSARKQLTKNIVTLRNTPTIRTSAHALLGQKVIDEQRSLRKLQSIFQRKLLAAQNKALVKILKRVKIAVRQIAKNKDLDIVLTQDNVAYNRSTMDITADVIKALK